MKKQILLALVICTVWVSCNIDPVAPVPDIRIAEQHVETSYKDANLTYLMEGLSCRANGGADCWTYDLEYSTSPDLSNCWMKTMTHTSQSETLSLSCALSTLQANTTYYYRMKINCGWVNNEMIIDSIRSFTTLSYEMPVVHTGNVTSVEYTSAVVSITLEQWGSNVLPKWGVCYSTKNSPTLDNSQVVYSTNQVTDRVSLTSLSANTTYYVRAFAKNELSTAYGEERSFTTKAYLPPTVTILESRYVSANGAIIHSEVLSDGGLEIQEQGVCYSSSTSTPTTSDQKVVYSTLGIGQYPCALTGLTAGTTYNVRAYAINARGTAYSDTYTFTTSN